MCKKIIVLFLIAIDCYVWTLKQECSPGVYTCDLLSWHQWSFCSLTCGGGVQKRKRSICCPENSTNSQCLSTCKYTNADVEERKSCGNTCTFGEYDDQTGKCHCTSGYDGTCCESASMSDSFPAPNSANSNGMPVIEDSAHESCFQNGSVKGLMAFLIICVVCLAGSIVLLLYFTLKVKKKNHASMSSQEKLAPTGSAPTSTMMKK